MSCENEKYTITAQQDEIKNLKQAVTDLANTSWGDVIVNTDIKQPVFWLSLLILYLFCTIPLITYMYNSILNRQVMLLLEQNGVLDAMVKAFKTDSFVVNIDGEQKTFRYFWDEVLIQIVKVITQGRFYMLIGLFCFLLATVLFSYSIIYRGENYQNAARMISIALATVLGFTFLFMNNQTMTNPFENVIGYGFAKFFYGKQLEASLTGIFKHKFFDNKYVFPGAKLYFDFILTSLNIQNFPSVLEEIHKNGEKYDFEINTDPDKGINKTHVDNLFQIVLNKNTIGNVSWMFLASLVGSMISFQYVLANEM